MEFAEWYPYYLKVVNDLNLDIRKDFLSSTILSNLISENKPPDLDNFGMLIGKKVLVIGSGPSIENKSIQEFIRNNSSSSIIISADGATELCLKLDIAPHFIITDLDGDISQLLKANELGSTLIIHAHGNNIDKITKFVREFSNFFGTTQAFPLYNIYNFGGFTDGDRSVFFADQFKSKEIWMVGMDFDSSIGFYSKKMKFNLTAKKKKLSIGKRLLEILSSKSNSLLINVTTFKFNSSINGIMDYKLE
ncbi:MAG: 6-hydroxymethylpterin diphosphokinase MptE-like protein [Candidatus Nitrosocosmicus sp.]